MNETLISDAQEQVKGLMSRLGVSRSELARRLGKSKAHVTQLFSDKANWTLRMMADIYHALGVAPTFNVVAETEVYAVYGMPGKGRGSPTRRWIEDKNLVVAGYIAEHDQTIVDAAWLEKVLGPEGKDIPVISGTVRWHTHNDSECALLIAHRWPKGSYDGYRVDNRTRSDVLGLLRWLGIELKGQP